MEVKILSTNALVPTRSHAAAAFDLYSTVSGIIAPGDRSVIPTGIAVSIPSGYYGQLFGRSGLAARHGICVLAGVIDNDYRGEIKAILHNLSKEPFEYKAGDRIVQMTLLPYLSVEARIVKELDVTARNEGGLGSTGY